MKERLPRFLTLEAWVAANYGDALSMNTARRWVRDGYIFPAPEKHGRAYYLERDARYVDPANPPPDLKPTGRPYPLVVKAGFVPAPGTSPRRTRGRA